VAVEQTDNPEMQKVARSLGANVVLVRNSLGNVQILTSAYRGRKFRLAALAAFLRLEEMKKRGIEPRYMDFNYLSQVGTIPECPYWYLHENEEMLLNGSESRRGVQPSMLERPLLLWALSHYLEFA
jgi:hypothetical protein